jgi:formaldehyde-activating enzyme
MAKINNLRVGESLNGDGNEVAHIDLMIGPRGSAAESAFANCLTNNKGIDISQYSQILHLWKTKLNIQTKLFAR